MSDQPFIVRPVNWKAQSDQLHAIRRSVFIEEQSVAEELEWDDTDGSCYHVLAFAADGSAIGTGRLALDGRIGRMAVLKEWRGRGVGSAILKYLLVLAQKEGHLTVRLHAQTHAVPFYAKHGFAAYGPEFLEAGISHLAMSIELDKLPNRRLRRGQ